MFLAPTELRWLGWVMRSHLTQVMGSMRFLLPAQHHLLRRKPSFIRNRRWHQRSWISLRKKLKAMRKVRERGNSLLTKVGCIKKILCFQSFYLPYLLPKTKFEGGKVLLYLLYIFFFMWSHKPLLIHKFGENICNLCPQHKNYPLQFKRQYR